MWQSADGNTWSQVSVAPTETLRYGQILSAVATDDMVYILAEYGERGDRLRVEQALADAGHVFDDFSLWYEGTSSWITLVGPFGVHVATVPFSEVGLTRGDVEGVGIGDRTAAWVTTDGSTWTERIQPEGMRTVFVGLDGRVFAQIPADVVGGYATGVLEPAAMTWEEVGPLSQVEVRGQWSGGFIGQFPHLSDQVAVSADGLTWRNLSPRSLLPREVEWSFDAVGGAESGVAVIGTAQTPPRAESQTVEWAQDGYTVVAHSNAFEIMKDGERIAWIPRWSTDDLIPNGRLDSAAGTLELLNPDTGDIVVTLDIADVSRRLPDAGMRPPSLIPGDVIGQAFLFSHSETWPTPGVIDTGAGFDVWTVQDFRVVSPDRASRILLTADRVIVATSGEAGTAVYVGEIPATP